MNSLIELYTYVNNIHWGQYSKYDYIRLMILSHCIRHPLLGTSKSCSGASHSQLRTRSQTDNTEQRTPPNRLEDRTRSKDMNDLSVGTHHGTVPYDRTRNSNNQYVMWLSLSPGTEHKVSFWR